MAWVEGVCLANSRKHAGRCVALLRTDGAGWVRPVSALEDGRLLPEDMVLPDGRLPQALDVLRVELARAAPQPHQPENWLCAARPWQRVAGGGGPRALAVMRAAVTRGPDILGSPRERVAAALFDTVPAAASLTLVVPENLCWTRSQSLRGYELLHGRFRLAGVDWELPLTDPGWEERIPAHGREQIPHAKLTTKRDCVPVLTISLSDPFEGCCYKLIAAVVEVPRAR